MSEISVVSRMRASWRVRARLGLALVAACLSLSVSSTALAQGTFDPLVMLTADGSQALHSRSRSLAIPQSGPVSLDFKFGFETDEVFGPGQFFDAFTISLQTLDDLFTLILVTADASGVLFAPPTPGVEPLADAAIHRSPMPSPSLTPNLAQQHAFSVSTVLPESLIGREVTLFLDLFDNNNGVISHGWLADITLVPEPTLWPLVPLAGLVWFLKRPRKH